MGLFNTLAGLLGDEEEGWEDRLKPSIIMISPDGDLFEAAWRKDTRSYEKFLGVWKRPGIKGASIQDLDVGPDSYSIAVHFVGKDNDLEANRFFISGKQTGKWVINHPNLDVLELYLASVGQGNDPTESGNITTMKTEWLESVEDAVFVSASQLENEIKSTGLLADISAAAQFASNVVQDAFNKIAALSNAVKKIIKELENFELIPPSALALLDGLNSTLENTPIDLSNLSSQVQEFTSLFSSDSETTEEASSIYVDLINSLPGPTNDQPTDESRNEVAVQELFASAALNGLTQAQSIGGTLSRSQAITNAELLKSTFEQVTESLDSTQTNFDNSTIDKQFFSQSQSYNDTLLLISLGIRLNLTTGFNLAVERRFTTTTERSPIEITVTEYGTLGENDSNLDFFLASNKLVGKSIRLVPTGTELVIY